MDSLYYRRTLSIVLLIVSSQTAFAAEVTGEFGLHFGGDTMTNVQTQDGNSDSLKAGEELSLAVGNVFSLGDSMQLALTFGMKKEVVYPADGAITFTRFPLDMLLLNRSGRWRYGGGLTIHMNPVYRVDTDSQQQTVEFENAPGALLDVRYNIFDEIFIAARYTMVRYVVENDPARTGYNGNSLGLLVGAQF